MADNDAILISGATGCIGSTLARSLHSGGQPLVLFGATPRASRSWPRSSRAPKYWSVTSARPTPSPT